MYADVRYCMLRQGGEGDDHNTQPVVAWMEQTSSHGAWGALLAPTLMFIIRLMTITNASPRLATRVAASSETTTRSIASPVRTTALARCPSAAHGAVRRATHGRSAERSAAAPVSSGRWQRAQRSAAFTCSAARRARRSAAGALEVWLFRRLHPQRGGAASASRRSPRHYVAQSLLQRCSAALAPAECACAQPRRTPARSLLPRSARVRSVDAA